MCVCAMLLAAVKVINLDENQNFISISSFLKHLKHICIRNENKFIPQQHQQRMATAAAAAANELCNEKLNFAFICFLALCKDDDCGSEIDFSYPFLHLILLWIEKVHHFKEL